MIGYDMDGVLTRQDFADDLKNAVVISGRTFAEYDYFARKVAGWCPVYIRGVGEFGDRQHAGEFKAETIDRLGLEKYYEDDPMQAQIIRQSCPDCEVVEVK